LSGELGIVGKVRHGGRLRRAAGVVLTAALGASGLVGLDAVVLAPPASAAAGDLTAGFSGGERTYTVPDGVRTLRVTLAGGAGGNGGNARTTGSGGQPGGQGASGAQVTAYLAVTPGQVLTYYVGGGGAAAPDYQGWGAAPTAGVFGGGNGGTGSTAISETSATGGGGAGGAASWLKIGGSYVVVAGGGGGGGGGGHVEPNIGFTQVYGGAGGAGGQDGGNGAGTQQVYLGNVVQQGAVGGRGGAAGITGASGKDAVDGKGGGGGGGGGGYAGCTSGNQTGGGSPGLGGFRTADRNAYHGGGGGGGGSSCAVAAATGVSFGAAGQTSGQAGSIQLSVPAATSTSLQLPNGGGVQGEAATFTAQVSPADGTGTVAFTAINRSGTQTTLCAASPVGANGVATCNAPASAFQSIGGLSIRATYSGSASLQGSASDQRSFSVGSRTFTVLQSGPTTVDRYTYATYTVSVLGGARDGQVNFTNNEGFVGQTRYLDNSLQATGTVVFTNAGPGTVTVTYNGDHAPGNTTGPSSLTFNVQVTTATGGETYKMVPENPSIPLGASQAFSTYAINADGVLNTFGEATASVKMTMENGSCYYAVHGQNPDWICTPTREGTHRVTATADDWSCLPSTGFACQRYYPTASTTLTARGPLAKMRLSAPAGVVDPGRPAPVTAVGLDASGNVLGPVRPTLSIDGDGSCFATTCVGTFGNYTVTGTLPRPGGGTITATTPLFVYINQSDLGAVTSNYLYDPGAVAAGQAVTLHALLSATAGTQQASLSFLLDGEPVPGCQRVTNFSQDGSGDYYCTTTVQEPGRRAVTSVYAGDQNNRRSASTRFVEVSGPQTGIAISHDGQQARAGSPVTFRVDRVDAGGNVLGPADVPVLRLPAGAGSCTGLTCTPTREGSTEVTATSGGYSDSTDLDVLPGPLAELVVESDEPSPDAGTAVPLRAIGFDAWGNSVGDRTGAATFTISGPGATCDGASCTAITAGDHVVTATVGSVAGDATLTVRPTALDRITLSPGSRTVTAGDRQDYSVVGFDRYDNPLGDQSRDLQLSITGPDSSCRDAGCASRAAGDHTVTATVGALTDTATLTVTAAPLDRIEVSPASTTIAAGGSRTYTAVGFDRFDNSLGDQTSQASLTVDGPGSSCSAATCTSTSAGHHTVTVTVGSVTAASTLAVTPAALSRLSVSPATATVVAGAPQAYTVEGYDAHGNSRGDVTDFVSLAMSGAGSSCADGTCTATKAGEHTVTATAGALTDAATLTVTPAALDRISLTPATATVVAGEAQVYAVEGFDQYDNSLGDRTSATTFAISGSGPQSCTDATCTATKVGDHTVTATVGILTDTSTLTVSPAGLARITVSPGARTITAGDSQDYAVEGFDSFDNSLGDRTSTTTFSISGPGSSCAGVSCTATAAGAHTVTATVGALTDTAALTVTPAALDRIAVSPGSRTITAGDAQAYAVVGFDRYDNSLGDQASATTLAITGAGASCDAGSCTATKVGDHTVTATVGTLTDSATLSVTPAGLDHIRLSPATKTAAAGAPTPFRVEGFDAFDNDLGSRTSTAYIEISGGGCFQGSCRSTKVGDHTVTATLGVMTATATLTVIPLPYLGRITLASHSGSITAGGDQSYTVEGFDPFGNSLGDRTGAATFTISGAGASCTGATCTATEAGDHTVTATVGAFSDTATLTVTPAALDRISLSPASATAVAGEDMGYAVEGFDGYDNSVGDRTGAATFTISGAGASCTDATCTATGAGDHTVTATLGALTDTSDLTVTPAALDRIAVSPGSRTITAGDDQDYAVEGFDRYDNTIGDETAATMFSISGAGASCTGATCTASTAIDHTVTATLGALTDTATLTVTPAALDRISLSPETATLVAGGDEDYAVEGFDQYDNPVGDRTAAATLTISGAGSSCAEGSCTATRAGDHTVTATVGAFSDTSVLTVTPAALDRISLSPGTATAVAGEGQGYAVEGFDRFDNSVGDRTSAATFAVAGAGASCTGATCTATRAGDHTVTATLGARTGTATLTVTPAALARIAVSPGSSSITAGDAQAYAVVGFDRYDNPLGDHTSATTFTISGAGASCTGGTCTATKAGDHTVTATLGALTDTATLSVTPAGLARTVVTPGTVQMAAGESRVFTVEAFDRYDNSLGDRTAASTFTITGPGSGFCVGATCTATKAGRHTVTAAIGQVSDSASAMVVPARLDRITLSPATSTVVAGVPVAYTVEGFDRYRNSLGDRTAVSTLTMSGAGSTCAEGTCTSTTAGEHTVTATVGDVTEVAVVTVRPAAVATIAIRPQRSQRISRSWHYYRLAASDVYGNVVRDVPMRLHIQALHRGDDRGAECGANACRARAAGVYLVTARAAGLFATARLVITKGRQA
jgi:hypothetical protein